MRLRSTVLAFLLFIVIGVGLALLAALVVALVTAAAVATLAAVICAPVIALKSLSRSTTLYRTALPVDPAPPDTPTAPPGRPRSVIASG
jgi:hypothetical protein